MGTNNTPSGSEIVKRFYDLAVEGDVDGAFAMMYPDFVADIPPVLPWGGTHRSAQAFRSVVQAKLANILDLHSVKLLRVYGEGNDVFALLTALTGDGESVTMAEDWVLRDGKLQSVQVFYFDTSPVTRLYEKQKNAA